MTNKYYVDACIWIDYLENRSDRFRPLGDWALAMFKKIIVNEEFFIISRPLLEELEERYSPEKLRELFDFIPEELILKIEANKKQFKKALDLSRKLKLPLKDVLHAVLAGDNIAFLVTRDKHFLELTGIAEVKKPEELI
ncbi:MAG: PIN domain-containing protein [Candidatus Woesearchaeota archaeon]